MLFFAPTEFLQQFLCEAGFFGEIKMRLWADRQPYYASPYNAEYDGYMQLETTQIVLIVLGVVAGLGVLVAVCVWAKRRQEE